ncbi:uncharacterized protein [Dermacentor albipictus]|uniref:uncharacterized protein n=1 Tax=Dermacentor albipictus TaxID=60249 RepID=UPI0038FD10CF
MKISACFFVTIFGLQISANELPEICTSPRMLPTCTGNLFRVYYYDSDSEQCLPEDTCVSADSFKSLKECQETCLRKKGKDVPVRKGMPLFLRQNFYAKPSTYGGFYVHPYISPYISWTTHVRYPFFY